MKKSILFSTLLCCVGGVFADSSLNAEQSKQYQQEIRQTMDQSVDCWNNGDLDCFMGSYVKSKDIVFISGDKFIYGWQNAYDHYKMKYGTNKKAMGQLQISVNEVQILDPNHAYLFGRFHLVIESKEYNGVTSLIFAKEQNNWKIMLDHSS